MRQKKTIEDVAKAEMTPRNQINCSGFVRDVALAVGEYMPAMQANEMVAYLAKAPSWEQLGNNDMLASQRAGQGYLVIAGTINPHGHGHVVIIVQGREGRYASAYWGALGNANGRGEGKGIDHAWTHTELHDVQFLAIRSPNLMSDP